MQVKHRGVYKLHNVSEYVAKSVQHSESNESYEASMTSTDMHLMPCLYWISGYPLLGQGMSCLQLIYSSILLILNSMQEDLIWA